MKLLLLENVDRMIGCSITVGGIELELLLTAQTNMISIERRS